MQDQRVTLSMFSESLHAFTADVRVINEQSRQDQFRFKTAQNEGGSEIFLGNLSTLGQSSLIVFTEAIKVIDRDLFKMQYQIKYGEQEVERTTMESHFLDKQVTSLLFTFHFCPRYPFC